MEIIRKKMKYLLYVKIHRLLIKKNQDKRMVSYTFYFQSIITIIPINTD